MVTLTQSNPYVRDPNKRRKMLADNARQSSVFEGAMLVSVGNVSHSRFSNRAVMALEKKVVRGS
jgi:hypothetical protein